MSKETMYDWKIQRIIDISIGLVRVKRLSIENEPVLYECACCGAEGEKKEELHHSAIDCSYLIAKQLKGENK